MKLAQYLEELDPELAGKLEKAVNAVREDFEEKLTGAVQTAVSEAAEQAAERAAAEAAQQPPEVIARPTLSLDASDELRMAALDIDVATSQAEILAALSRGVLRFASRVAIFVNRGEEAHGWSSSGFGSSDSRIKEVVLAKDKLFPATNDPKEGSVALAPAQCAAICDAMGADHPSMGLVMPFVLGSQAVGTVYCDRVGEEPFSVSAMQLVTYIAGQTLETLPVRKRESTATLSLAANPVAAESMPTATAEVEIEPAAELEPAPTEPIASPEPPPVSDYESEPSEPVEMPTVHLVEEPEVSVEPTSYPPSSAPEIATESPEADEDEEATRPGFATRAPIEPSASPPSALGPMEPPVELGSTAVSPPDDVQGPGWAFTAPAAPSEGDSESDHEEAQRLARLLVTEIKLYNEEAVEEGRRSSNIYSRLREDIDRSRQIFEDRIDESVRTETDYFKKALVRILAGGDPALLGG